MAIAKEPATRSEDPTAEIRRKLAALLDQQTLTFAGEVNLEAPRVRGSDWDVVVKQVRFKDWFQETAKTAAAPISPPRSADREVYCFAGPDATRPLFDFFVELDDQQGAEKIAEALDHLAKQRSLRAVNNETSQLGEAVKINLLRVLGDPSANPPREELVELPKDGQDYSFDQGEILRVEIENQSNQDLYVTLFAISTDGSIQILYPPPGGTQLIGKGAKFKLPFMLQISGPAGYESYKIIASTDKRGSSDFAFLEQSAVRKRGACR